MSSDFFPVLGVILSNALYLSGVPAVYRAHQAGSVGSLNVLPQALMCLSTIAWISYALAVPDAYIVCSNLPGAIGAVWFITVLLPIIPRDRDRTAVQGVLTLGAAAQLMLWTVLVLSGVSHATRLYALGSWGSIICIGLFASPLSTVRTIMRTSNAASIYAPLTATQCANCLMWTIYGSSIGDMWVWGPNSAGLALGLAQLALKLSYPSSPQSHEGYGIVRGKENMSDDEQLGLYM